jgi:hypothetical protein
MKIVLDIEENGQVVRSIEADADEHDNIGVVAPRFAAALGLELEELLEDLSVDGKQLDHRDRVPDCNGHGHHLRHRRVRINLHFETESHEHRFPARAKWARVHHWGCKHFHVAHDACANLELHDGAIPPRTAALLVGWLSAAVGPEPTAWVFASENRETPLWRDNLLRRHLRPALEKVNLGWVDFKVMRRTNASLGHDAKVDPKVSADQRGHGIGVSLDVYTKSSMGKKAAAAKKLEDSVLGRKVIRIPKQKAS